MTAATSSPQWTRWTRSLLGFVLCVLCVLRGGELLCAQLEMPDPKQMSGIPRPDPALATGSMTVRVIRGALSNNIANQPVELHFIDSGDKVQTLKTDAEGRAQFDKLPAGASLQAVTVVDGERLESQVFPAPTSGGIRLMLVATDKEKAAKEAEAAAAPAVTGQVVLGGESRIEIDPGDELIALYYIIDVVNNASTPVNPPALFTFEMPTGTVGVSLFKGSSPLAAFTGTHVRVQGPFPPGKTSFQVSARIPFTGDSLEIGQAFPATWEQPLVIVKKFGSTKVSSPQIERQQEMTDQGVIVAAGRSLPANQTLTLTLSDMPHHSLAPRRIALGLAIAVALTGIWGMWMRIEAPAKVERKRLVARREKLFQDLVRLEQDQRNGRGDRSRYNARREDLIAALERVYGELDVDDPILRRTPTTDTGLPA